MSTSGSSPASTEAKAEVKAEVKPEVKTASGTTAASDAKPLLATVRGVGHSFIELLDQNVLRTLPEIGHLAPIILIFGSLLVSLATLNTPFFVLGASSVEALALYSVIYNIAGFAVTPFSGMKDSAGEGEGCTSFFKTLSPSRFKWMISQGLRKEFPNQPLYFISFAAAYCIQSMYFFSQECSELGPQYSNRPYLAIISAAMFILLYAIYLSASGCDSTSRLMFTILLGGLVGYLICNQNYLLFGKNSVNLLFLPTLARRSGMDYVCVTTSPSTA
jgi:hypothetical protein